MESSSLYKGGIIMDTRILENEVKVALKCIEKGVNFILEVY